MESGRIDRVRLEMSRLMDAIKELEVAGTYVLGDFRYYSSGKLTGAVRRASLDLTRALADLRRR